MTPDERRELARRAVAGAMYGGWNSGEISDAAWQSIKAGKNAAGPSYDFICRMADAAYAATLESLLEPDDAMKAVAVVVEGAEAERRLTKHSDMATGVNVPRLTVDGDLVLKVHTAMIRAAMGDTPENPE